MKTYKLVTACVLSEYYVGLITGIILSIAGNCAPYVISGYGLSLNSYNVFEFRADEKTKKEVKKTVDAWFDGTHLITESQNEACQDRFFVTCSK